MTARTLFVRGSLAFALLLVPVWCFAARPTAKSMSASASTSKDNASTSEGERGSVDLFDAIDAGLVEVKFIPKNEKQAHVRIKNRSGKPLGVRLPEAFGARAVLAQAAGAGMLNDFVKNAQNGGAQNLGGNFGAPNNRNGGVFNVPADKPAELRVACVCLEYGKPTPRPAIPYEMVRLDTVSKEPSLAGLLHRLEASNQREVQAAAWHFVGGMSWRQLAAVHVEHLVEANEPLFTAGDLKKAKELVDEVAADAKRSESQSGQAGAHGDEGRGESPGRSAALAASH
ncbi:MAG TPA: hypothetical protein VG826_09250 [Pirellulales bacterium]|nr:hypothetical protein [Pirellulales bacterium]